MHPAPNGLCMVPLQHLAHPEHLAAEVKVVAAALQAGLYHRLAALGIGAGQVEQHKAAACQALQAGRVVDVADLGFKVAAGQIGQGVGTASGQQHAQPAAGRLAPQRPHQLPAREAGRAQQGQVDVFLVAHRAIIASCLPPVSLRSPPPEGAPRSWGGPATALLTHESQSNRQRRLPARLPRHLRAASPCEG
jgi:hypothetical protein